MLQVFGAVSTCHTTQTVPLLSVTHGNEQLFIEMRNYPTGWVVGGDVLSDGRLLKTTDGGDNWFEQGAISLPGWAKEVRFTSDQAGWILSGTLLGGASQYLHRTTDGGLTWDVVLSGIADEGFSSMSFVTDSIGWVATYDPHLYQTGDGGLTWNEIKIPEPFERIEFSDKLHGWGGGSSGEVYFSLDGGANWTPQLCPLGGNVNDFAFVDSSNGWLVAGGGAILHTFNGGTTSVDETTRPPSVPFIACQNYPNPFNSSTVLRIVLPEQDVLSSVIVYDVLGKRIRSIRIRSAAAGTIFLEWDGKDELGRVMPTGVYFYGVSSSHSSVWQKMVLIR